MADKKIAAYGSWKSPITSDLIVAGTVGLGQVRLDGEDVYWIEQRPTQGGRNVVVRRTPDGKITDRTPPPFNARTRVHEYGGGAYVVHGGAIYFSNFADQRLYCQVGNANPQALTSGQALRYADAVVDSSRDRLICVREDHRTEGQEALNTVVGIDLTKGEETVLVSGNDFYSNPRLSPDGSQLAWLTWKHPYMPWDGTELWVGKIQSDGSLAESAHIAGGDTESVFQPEWSPFGILYFVSDRSGWWNLYRLRNGNIEVLCEKEADFGRAQWVFGMGTYAFVSASQIICTYTEDGSWYMASLDPGTLRFDPIALPYTELGGVQVKSGNVFFLAGSPTEPISIVRLDPKKQHTTVLRRSSEITLTPGCLSAPQAVEFPTEQGRAAYGLFYPPKNTDFSAPEDERPPLLVKSHGGPTAAAQTACDLRTQSWTSRGFAVLDVNYGGSSGYGRAYRQRLNGQWGIVDVDDCVNGARFLVERGDVDGKRLTITGGSAGGYTTLCALTFRDTFQAGASHYGISDLEALAHDTHKFESHYEESLVGPYPEREDLYRERSPIHFTHQLSCPLIIFQGLEDKIVPPNQAELMVSALRAKGLPVAYVPFEGEQHGFRQAENIKRALDGELYFYSRIFNFTLADAVEPVAIENLPD